jgi:acetone carboxylase alpha subunit
VRELIERERLSQQERVKRRTVPGRLRTIGVHENYYSDMPVPPHHAVDYITFVPFDFFIRRDGTYFWDFDGAGDWGWHPNNTSPSAMNGASCLFLTQTIAYTGHANTGTLLNVEVNCPYDTFVNPSSPWIATGGFISGANVLGALAVGLQSRAFFSRGFVEEVMASSPSFFGWGLAGKNQLGKDFGQLYPGELAGTNASGACAIRDGFVGYVIWLPPEDMGNIEIREVGFPLICTGRRLLPDSCGWGKYRSGYPIVSTYMVYWSPKVVFDLAPHSTNDKVYLDTGMFGGYPGVNQFARLLVKSNTLELIEQEKPLVHGIGLPEKDEMRQNVTGKLVEETCGSRFIRDIARAGDIMQVAYSGNAGGFGDPIKREPALIKKDLDLGLLALERCRRIYCVEARYDEKAEEWVIDREKTAELREKRRKERLAKGIPVKEWWQKRRNDIVEGKMPPILKKTYNGSLANGERWPGEFREFWGLPSDFTFKVEEV